ncbi:hypothetical protein NFI96_011182, partial [Prochilodus magdalenae]
VGGLALVAVGIWLNADGGSYLQILGIVSLDILHFVNVGFFFSSIGGVMALMGFLGCCGAKKESKCLLIMFFSIILIIFISELAAAVVILAYSSLVSFALRPSLPIPTLTSLIPVSLENILSFWSTPVLKEQYGKDTVVTEMWNVTMTKLSCCGFNNYTDFNDSYYYKENGNVYPLSCCKDTKIICGMKNALNSAIQGCYERLTLIIQKKTYIVGAVAAGVCGLELTAMAVSMYMYCYLDGEGS